MKVLLVEDSERLRRSLGTSLKKAGHAVDVAGNGEDGLWLATSQSYDVIVLDIMLPKLDGLSLLQELRQRGSSSHVLLLTAKDTVTDRVKGLQAGADDYLVKPFALDELLARVQALGRRAYGRKDPRIVIGDLEIDTGARLVTRAGLEVKLKPREYALLEYLALRSGQVVSRREIETHIYDDEVDPMSNVIDSAISVLRKQLARKGRPPLIHTRHRHGYVLKASDS